MNQRALKFQQSLLWILLLTLPSGFARADIGDTFGFGSRAAALGNALVAGPNDGYDAYTNPAKLTSTGDNRWSFSYGFIWMQPKFIPITGVTIENKYTSDNDVIGDVVTDDYKVTFGQELALSYRLIPSDSNLTLGIVTFLPINQLAYADTGETFEPEYVLYRARTNRPQVEIGLGADLSSDIHVGIGIHTAFSLTANANAYVQSTAGHPSTIRFSTDLTPKFVPVFGFYYTPPASSFSAGLVVRLPVASNDTTTLNTGAAVAGFLPAIPLAFTAESSLYYDPLSVELGASFKVNEDWRAYLELDYERWSKFQAPALIIQSGSSSDSGGGTVQFSPGPDLAFPYRDTYTPRLGSEWLVGSTQLRAGYSFHESIFSALPTGAGNYLDPARHNLDVGAGFHFPAFLGGIHPWNLDLHASYAFLVTQNITKTPGDESGASGDSKVGSPGYQAGGKEYGGGATVTVEF